MPDEKSQQRVDTAPRRADAWVYLAIVFCTVANAVFGGYQPNADVVAYLDISDAILGHHWHSVINGYWSPGYPALLALARIPLGHSLRYELMAARLLGALTNLLFIFSAVFLVKCVRTLQKSSGVSQPAPPETLNVWAAILAFCFSAKYLAMVNPDSLLSALLLFTLGFMVRAIAKSELRSWAAAGAFAGLAYWTKSFAFSFFLVCIVIFALMHYRKAYVWRGLAVSLVIFAAVASPWILGLSKQEGRFTLGSTGKLATAWYVNGADRFNPVDDSRLFSPGRATARFRHPGELISADPEVVYFDGRISGTTPQWDNPAFWEDGLAPRFVLGQVIGTIARQFVALLRVCGGSLAAFILAAVLPAFGFRPRKGWLSDPTFVSLLVVALSAIAIYMLVLVEGRYISFALVIAGVVYAASCTSNNSDARQRVYLNTAVILAGLLIVAARFDDIMTERRLMVQSGGNPLRGIYDLSVISSATDLAKLYSPGSEVACMGDQSCWADPYWARYARLRMSTIIESGNGWKQEDAYAGCNKLERNPGSLDALRARGIRAIVAKFDDGPPCSTMWKHIGSRGGYYYLPL